jgi:hypothetical protein
VPKRRARKQTGGVVNTGTMVADGDIVGRNKIIHQHGLSEERLLAIFTQSQQRLLDDLQRAGLHTSTIIALARGLKPDVLDPDQAVVEPTRANDMAVTVHGEHPVAPILRIFLCHASEDKEAVRALYRNLRLPGFDPWLDEEKLLPGQDWDVEITKAIRSSHVFLVCLSRRSDKRGYVQKEIVRALDVADEQPEGTIFLIPVLLEDCEVPDRLRKWHWVNLAHDNGFGRLQASLKERQASLGGTPI